MFALPATVETAAKTRLFGWRWLGRRLVRLGRGAEQKRLERRALVGESANFDAVDRVGVDDFLRREATSFGDHFRKLRVEISAVPSDRRKFDPRPIIERNDPGADVEATRERRFEERPSVGVGRGTESARRFPNDSGGQRLETEKERPKTLFVIAVGKVFEEHRLILGAKSGDGRASAEAPVVEAENGASTRRQRRVLIIRAKSAQKAESTSDGGEKRVAASRISDGERAKRRRRNDKRQYNGSAARFQGFSRIFSLFSPILRSSTARRRTTGRFGETLRGERRTTGRFGETLREERRTSRRFLREEKGVAASTNGGERV